MEGSRSCGHEVNQKGECLLLCDDFVSGTSGLCYLGAFDLQYRRCAMDQLGFYPFACQFNKLYLSSDYSIEASVIPPYLRGGHLHVSSSFESSEHFAVVGIKECSACKRVTKSYSCIIRPSSLVDCKYSSCGGESTVRAMSMIRFTYFSNRMGSRVFSVRNLTLGIEAATSFDFPGETLFVSEAPLPDTTCLVSEDGDVVSMSINGDSTSYSRTSQKLKGFVHDYVASCWTDTSDSPLSSLGVEGPSGQLTPDFISVGTRTVLEVATCASDSTKSLERAYQTKVMKYHDELELISCRFLIIVISPQKVLTNAPVSPAQVDALTTRMRQAQILRQRLIESLGHDIEDDEFNEQEKLTRSMFTFTRKDIKLDSKYMYDMDEIRSFKEPITDYESTSAARVLLNQYKTTGKAHSCDRGLLTSYLASFTSDNSRNDKKRVSNVPIVLPCSQTSEMDPNLEGNNSLRLLWGQSLEKQRQAPSRTPTVESLINDEGRVEKHLSKRDALFKSQLAEPDKIDLALSGIGGKAYKDDQDVSSHRVKGKLSFHPLTDTEDIDDFLRNDLLHETGDRNPFLPYYLEAAVTKSKEICCGPTGNLSVELWRKIMGTDLMFYSMMMTKVFMELSYAYKHWTNHYEFLVKDIGHGIKLLIYNPKSTLFVSFAFPRHGAKMWDRGRLGPKLYFSSSHIFSDWSSFDNSQLEHFIKFGPYLGSCLVDLMNSSSSSSEEFSRYSRDCIPHLLLLYCNNKTDVEELITSQRYLFMKLLEDVGKSPYMFVERLPKVLRSRLTCYYLKKTISLLDYYDKHSITKMPKQGEDMITYDYMNIKSLFSDQFIDLPSKINEFYFGYVVSKERNTGKDKTFKVLTKLIKQEQKFRATMKGSMFTEGEVYEEFKTNKSVLKFFSHSLADSLQDKFGPEFKSKIMQDFLHQAARTNFSDLATLKVSSRDHSKDVEVPLGSDSTEETYKKLSKDFPEEILKRPFCMESMAQLIREYEECTGKSIVHISQLAPWCLNNLLEKGYFDSDQFDKSQHGGEREIHVLEFKARVVQYFLELISRTVCSYFPSETTINPDTKERFVKDHYSRSREAFGTAFTTISKSADATTWCQFHHTSHFAAMFQVILPEELAEFSIQALSLWPRKRLSFPLKQASSLSANMKLQTSNSVYMKFKSEFEEGKGMFLKPRSNVIEVISGMFQGILHTTSSLYHTMMQEGMKKVVVLACAGRLGVPKVVVTVCQGSDDSAMMISLPGKPSMRSFQLAKRLLLWKERVSPYLSMFCNEAKSSIGTHDLVEYNSEWHIRHMIVKPTFRWVSASQEVSVTERFIDRLRMYYNMVTECLSGGASSLECAVIQLMQATMHYSLMGLLSHKITEIQHMYVSMLLEDPEPVHGFFPMDEDLCCGVPGIEFLLFKLYNTTSFGGNLRVLGDSDTSMDYSPEDLPNWMKTKDLSSVRLKFSKMSVFYRVVERMNLEPLEDAIRNIEEDPSILFNQSNSWSDEQHNLVLKVFSKGVKESISNKSSMLRMAASSAYILTNKCFSYSGEGTGEKHTLLHLMHRHRGKTSKFSKTENDRRALFPFHAEYLKLDADVKNLKENGVVIDQYTKRTSKVNLTVIPRPVGDVEVIEMCKRKWFGRGALSLSRGQFAQKWGDLASKFPFLSSKRGPEGLRETASSLKLNVIQTKMFLESMTQRSRSIVLYDSASRAGSLSYSLSRIYWPNKKVVLTTSSLDDKTMQLRSRLFSVLTFWFSKDYTDHLCKELVRTDIYLRDSSSTLPSHAIRLKIMHDLLNGHSPSELLPRIEQCRKGVLGSYTQPQKGRGTNRRGVGVWQGSICGISVRIAMRDNVCESITVKNLYDTVSLGWQLNQFMNESKLQMPVWEAGKNHLTTCWLTHDAKIVSSPTSRGVPIYQDRLLQVVRADDTVNMVWFMDTNNNNLRIRTRDPHTGMTYTVLSEVIMSRDWVPGLSVELNDPVFDKWSRGEALHLPSFEKMLMDGFPTSAYDFMKRKDSFEKGKMVNKFNWDLKRTQSNLKDCIVNRSYNPDLSKQDEATDTNGNHSAASAKLMSMLDSYEDEFEALLEQEVANWAEEVEMEEEFTSSLWALEMTSAEEEEMRAAMNLFTDVSTDNFYELVDRSDLSRNYMMPAASRFLSPLEHVNMIMNEESMRSSILESKRAPGVLGILYSIVSGKYLVGKDDGVLADVLSVEEEMSSVSSSISRPGAMLSLGLDDIRIHIANIQDQMEAQPGKPAKRLSRLLGIYKDREEEILSRTSPLTQDLIMLNSDLVMNQIRTFMINNNLFPMSIQGLDTELQDNLMITMIRTEATRSQLLSRTEVEELSLHLSTKSLNRGVLQSISVIYGYGINVNGDVVSSSGSTGMTLDIQI